MSTDHRQLGRELGLFRTDPLVGAGLPLWLPDGAIVRGEQVIMAHHDTVLACDDHVILFLSDRRHVEAVERLFLGPPR